jgi:hypothetical protein
MKVELPRQFSKIPQMSNLIKIRAEETGLFHADGQTQRDGGTGERTDRYDGVNSRFSQFCGIRCNQIHKMTYVHVKLTNMNDKPIRFVLILFCDIICQLKDFVLYTSSSSSSSSSSLFSTVRNKILL